MGMEKEEQTRTELREKKRIIDEQNARKKDEEEQKQKADTDKKAQEEKDKQSKEEASKNQDKSAPNPQSPIHLQKSEPANEAQRLKINSTVSAPTMTTQDQVNQTVLQQNQTADHKLPESSKVTKIEKEVKNTTQQESKIQN